MTRLAALAALALVAIAPAAARASFTQDVGSPLPTGTAPYGVAAADFDGNGRADVATANGTAGTISVLLRGLGGGFAPEGASIPAGEGASDVVAADFNRDGRPDLAVASYTAQGGRVLLRTDSGFALENGATLAVPGATSVAVGDLNADGNLDLVFGSTPTDSVFYALRNAGNTGFLAPVRLQSVGHKGAVGIADFTADGQPDILATNETSPTLDLWVQKDDGSFTPAPDSPFAVGPRPFGLAIADFNGDGRPDAAVGRYEADSVLLMLGQPGGALAPEGPYPVGDGPVGLEVADINSDGAPDLIAANQAGKTVSVLLRTAGGFVPDAGSPIVTNQSATAVAVADFDVDTRPDLAVANYDSNSLSVLLNTTPFPVPPPPPNLDADADGVRQPLDCRDDDPAIRPGAPDAPGDGIDQDCSGADADYPLLQRQIAHELAVYQAGYAQFRKLTIAPVRAGDRIALSCSGRGCPFKRATVRVKRDKRKLSLAGRFKRARLRKATVTLVVTRPGTLGRHRRFTFRPGKAPALRSRCVRPGVAKPIACPA